MDGRGRALLFEGTDSDYRDAQTWIQRVPGRGRKAEAVRKWRDEKNISLDHRRLGAEMQPGDQADPDLPTNNDSAPDSEPLTQDLEQDYSNALAWIDKHPGYGCVTAATDRWRTEYGIALQYRTLMRRSNRVSSGPMTEEGSGCVIAAFLVVLQLSLN